MPYINIYSTKPTQEDFPKLAHHRLTEIELFLMFQKLKNHAPMENTNTDFAADTLMQLLNRDNVHTELDMDKLRDHIIRDKNIVPTMDEYIVYLRTQQFGVNKITAITKKQHYYLKTLLAQYDNALLIPEMGYDWRWDELPVIQDTSHHLARDLFQIHQQDFHDTLGFKFPKKKHVNKSIVTTKTKWF